MKKITAAALAALLALSMGAVCPAAEMVGVSGEESAQEEKKAIGEKTEDARVLELKNGTGKDITAFAIKLAEEDEEEFSENLLSAEDVFADGETRTFFYAKKKSEDDEESTEAETSAETDEESTEAETNSENSGAPGEAVMTVRLTFADETTAKLHVWELEGIETFEIRLEEETAYLAYEKEEQAMSTLEWEKAEEAEEAIPEYDDTYYDDTYYEDDYYDDSYYDDTYYDDYGGDGGAAEENCLQGGLMN